MLAKAERKDKSGESFETAKSFFKLLRHMFSSNEKMPNRGAQTNQRQQLTITSSGQPHYQQTNTKVETTRKSDDIGCSSTTSSFSGVYGQTTSNSTNRIGSSSTSSGYPSVHGQTTSNSTNRIGSSSTSSGYPSVLDQTTSNSTNRIGSSGTSSGYPSVYGQTTSNSTNRIGSSGTSSGYPSVYGQTTSNSSNDVVCNQNRTLTKNSFHQFDYQPGETEWERLRRLDGIRGRNSIAEYSPLYENSTSTTKAGSNTLQKSSAAAWNFTIENQSSRASQRETIQITAKREETITLSIRKIEHQEEETDFDILKAWNGFRTNSPLPTPCKRNNKTSTTSWKTYETDSDTCNNNYTDSDNDSSNRRARRFEDVPSWMKTTANRTVTKNKIPAYDSDNNSLHSEDSSVYGSTRRNIGVRREYYRDIPHWKQNSANNAVLTSQRRKLPIFALKEELLEKIRRFQIVIIVGETGSGKTTQIPQFLVEAGYAETGKIACTQPRRVAATSVAKRVSEEYGCNLGDEIGYKIRFEECSSSKTKILYMTDGMLLRECINDSHFEKFSVIMLDEAHERTVSTDVLFSLLKDVLRKRKDLKLIVSSATLQAEKFSRYFNGALIFKIPGRTYPVNIVYHDWPVERFVEASVDKVLQIHRTKPLGDVLVFLPGTDDIEKACRRLKDRDDPNIFVLPLYAGLPPQKQARVFNSAPAGSRKVVFSTNVAETSITIDGISYVVDPGFFKQKVCNEKSGMDVLKVIRISQAQAEQRAGRAGRTGPGTCYRLYTTRVYEDEMLPTNTPEIQRTTLAGIVLSLKALDIHNLHSFDFMDPPTKEAIDVAMKKLRELGAIDDAGLLTALGRMMNNFPKDPTLTKVLLKSVELQCSDECLTIVSMLEEEHLFFRPMKKAAEADARKAVFNQLQGDHLTLLAVYRAWKSNNCSEKWCHENFLNFRVLKTARNVRHQLATIMKRHELEICSCSNARTIQRAIFSGYFRNLARWDFLERAYRRVVDNQRLHLHPSSSLFRKNTEWVVYHEVLVTSKEFMRTVTAVDSDWLNQLPSNFRKLYFRSSLNKL